MPHIKQAELSNLLLAGEWMSNVCFNLSQSEKIPAGHRKIMKECYEAWDAARAAVRRAGSSSPTESTRK